MVNCAPIGAITGHTTLKEIARYTRAARQKIFAQRAMAKLSAGQKGEQSVPLRVAKRGGGTQPVASSWWIRCEVCGWCPGADSTHRHHDFQTHATLCLSMVFLQTGPSLRHQRSMTYTEVAN